MSNVFEKTAPDPRRKSSIIWVGITQAAAAAGSYALVSGGSVFRIFALGAAATGLLIPLFYSLEAGLMAMVIFEPFRGILRRAQYLLVPYSSNEPIHLITPFVAMIAFTLLLSRQKLDVFRETVLAGPVTVLALICFLQVFNPLQGGLFIGMSGALFYLLPMLWFYFGQAAADNFFPKVIRAVVILGIICSLYGVYQTIFGYPEFELYWLENTDKYSSINVYNIKRALATFSNAEEWGRYVQLGCFAAFGLGIMRSEGNKRIFWLSSGVFLCGMLALTGQRSSVFGLFLGLAILIVTGSRSFGNAVSRILVICLPLVLVFSFSKALSEDDIYDIDESSGVSTILSHTTKGTVDPTSEGSLYARFNTWGHIVTEVIPKNPLGAGLGESSISASRDSPAETAAIDNHFLSLAISAGLPAALLLIWILFKAFVLSTRSIRRSKFGSDDFVMWRIAMAMLSSFVLNNFFGTSFVIYSVAPLGWLLIGWISRNASKEGIDGPAGDRVEENTAQA